MARIKKTSSEWMKEFGNRYRIIDADGWDRAIFDYSFNKEKITRDEFKKRLSLSTVRIKLSAIS